MFHSIVLAIFSALKSTLHNFIVKYLKKICSVIFSNNQKLIAIRFIFLCSLSIFALYGLSSYIRKQDTYYYSFNNIKKIDKDIKAGLLNILQECGNKTTFSLLVFNKTNNDYNDMTNISIVNSFWFATVLMLDKNYNKMINLRITDPQDKIYFYNTEHSIDPKLNYILLKSKTKESHCFSSNIDDVNNYRCQYIQKNNKNSQTPNIIQIAFNNLSVKYLEGMVIKEKDVETSKVLYVLTLGVVDEDNCSRQQKQQKLEQIANILIKKPIFYNLHH